jgi:hypothetical protein
VPTLAMARLSADGLGEDDEVAVGVSQPDLALPGVGVDVNVELDARLKFAGAAHRRVKLLDLEPDGHAISHRDGRLCERAMMMFYVAAV